ncbi:hypothetical protein HPP92_022664 [Vanilla planifolia]|uniref:J domain-containing protein n=1 Tax=Vanilla planifolia TaxID=51239 RepID=A0A835UDE6_VANPL|nr:hypothetical protein HPP92_022664 [Vanilla planifolia]
MQGYNRYTKRTKRIESKKTLLREVSEYAEQLFQSWRDDDNIVWFRKHYWSKGVKLNGFSSHEVRYGRSSRKKHNGFDFCTSDDDDDVDIIFQSVFGGEQGFYWSSCRSEHSKRQQSSGHNHKVFTDWRNATDGETDEDVGADAELQIDLTSERLALGLSASGPLKLEEIKRAYRECAFRWHPDRHRDASKALAEEKFKHCSAAYKSLCDWFASS